MPTYTAAVLWHRQDGEPVGGFLGKRYSRRHLLRFDGGLEVPGSSSPQVVPVPMSDASALDKLHHEAHEACFIANPVKTEVRCKPVLAL
jgi:hypothetical protein